MRVLRVRNVHAALPEGLALLSECGISQPSRNGNCIVHPGPVTTIYERPDERVLFWPERDANPFLHFFEALWMLAGRNDLAYLTNFVKRFEQFSDDGETLNGAYGYRWRYAWGFDQIERLVALVKQSPQTRRAILTMFDPERDLVQDENANHDVCCNTQALFGFSYGRRDERNRLNMMITCRSNDIIWGAYGANAVHFSMLHEYMAARLNLELGEYHQMSWNYHAYENVLAKTHLTDTDNAGVNPYTTGVVKPYALVADPETWDRDLLLFLEDPASYGFLNPFFAQVAKPLWWAHVAYKRKAWNQAFEILDQCMAEDWRLAAGEWLQRRKDAWVHKRRVERPREEALL